MVTKLILLFTLAFVFEPCLGIDEILAAEIREQVKAPWLATMQVHGYHFCGAAIIGKKWILTSAFCTSGKIPVSLSVRVGSDSHDSGGLILKLNRFIQHESYKSPVHDFDYALLELTDSLNYTDKIQAVELPKILNFIDERSCTVSGWGQTKNPKAYKSTFQSYSVPIVKHERCSEIYASIHNITNQMICAGDKTLDENICRGNEGGPMTCFDPFSGKAVLTGIVSWAEGCNEGVRPRVYARVQAIRTWIKEKTGI